MVDVGKKYLITTDNWFFTPNGVQCKSVWGTVRGVYDSKETLNIQTNRNSTNWYVKIGNMIIAGCQIHYIVKTDKVNFDSVIDFAYDSSNQNFVTRPSYIYNADKEYLNENK